MNPQQLIRYIIKPAISGMGGKFFAQRRVFYMLDESHYIKTPNANGETIIRG